MLNTWREQHTWGVGPGGDSLLQGLEARWDTEEVEGDSERRDRSGTGRWARRTGSGIRFITAGFSRK